MINAIMIQGEGQIPTYVHNMFSASPIAPKYLRIAGILSVVAALGLTVANHLLEFSPEFHPFLVAILFIGGLFLWPEVFII